MVPGNDLKHIGLLNKETIFLVHHIGRVNRVAVLRRDKTDKIFDRSLCDFWATVCKTVRPILSDRCMSCLSVSK